MIEAVVNERRERGTFTNLKDFITRIADKDVNKRAIENFIKAGALDSLGGTRKQFMSVYVQIMDHVQRDKKNNMAGQMSLFDIVGEEEKDSFDVKLPNVGEYSKEMMLGFEKEVLGVYVSGHPLQEYETTWRKRISATTADFALDEETNTVRIKDGENVVVGGMIAEKTIKYTKNDKVMAFLTIEDLVGTVEVVVFPRDYEKNAVLLTEDAKVFVRGRASVEEDKDGKIICEKIMAFDKPTKKLWIQFPTMEAYKESEQKLFDAIAQSEGDDSVAIYIQNPKAMRELSRNHNVKADEALIHALQELFGEQNVRAVQQA